MCTSENISHRSLKKPRRRSSLPVIYCGIRILTFLGGTSAYKIERGAPPPPPPPPQPAEILKKRKKKQYKKQL